MEQPHAANLFEGPTVNVRFAPTLDEFLETTIRPFRKKQMSRMIWSAIGALACFGLAYSMSGNRDSFSMFFVAIGLVMGFSAAFQPTHTKNTLTKLFEGNPHYSEENVMTISPAGLRCDTPTAEVLVRWHSYTHFTESERIIYMHRGFSDASWIPKRALAGESELAELRNALMHYIGRTSPDRGFPVQPTPST